VPRNGHRGCCRSRLSETNTSYLNSGISQRLRLVHSQQVTYSENDDLEQDLHVLSNNNGTVLSTTLGNMAGSLRDEHNTDLVMLVTQPTNSNECGLMSSARLNPAVRAHVDPRSP
jgi:hypothetical protein